MEHDFPLDPALFSSSATQIPTAGPSRLRNQILDGSSNASDSESSESGSDENEEDDSGDDSEGVYSDQIASPGVGGNAKGKQAATDDWDEVRSLHLQLICIC